MAEQTRIVGKQILLVEDDHGARESIKRLLSVIVGSANRTSSPSKLQIHVRLPAVTFFDESDFTEPPQSPEEMAKVPHGDGAWPGPVDQFDEGSCCEEAPVMLQGLLNHFHHALLPVPVHFSFEAICRYRD